MLKPVHGLLFVFLPGAFFLYLRFRFPQKNDGLTGKYKTGFPGRTRRNRKPLPRSVGILGIRARRQGCFQRVVRSLSRP